MPRFAILVHDHPFLHWDLLLENDGACRAWRLLAAPDSESGEIDAQALDDHRLIYLDYEGPVSGGRGSVTRWDAGTFEWDVDGPEVCEILLDGLRWQGQARLVHIAGCDWKVFRINTARQHGSFQNRSD